MPRSYVDNASNRSLGRVGMSVGSMPVSRGSSGGGGGSSHGGGGGSSYGSGGGGSYSAPSAASSSSPKTYVDNSYNRQHGRVGMAHGDAVVSKSGASDVSASNSSTKTYVDNAYNRQHGRVGMSHGDAVVSKSGASDMSASNSSTKTYVDNAYNRKQGRVGMSHGDAVVSKSGASPKVYKDNPANKILGRVGKPLGTCVVSKSRNSSEGASKEVQLYVDNSLNRSLGRVGKPRGSMPHSKVSKKTEKVRKIRDELMNDWSDSDGHQVSEEMEQAMSTINRRLQELEWKEREGERPMKTTSSVLEQYTGTEISFDELELGSKIGQGGFGDVFLATWKNSVVALKKLRVQRVSKKRLEDFGKEVMAFCDLDHPNIVKFIGACLKTPNLCIVMEYMQTCLYTALYMSDQDIEFSDADKLSILQQTSEGLLYLHENRIAHCDLKSQNVLLEYLAGESCVAKITDFGLSMIRANTESSTSALEQVRNIGTPRYSAPEVLRGEMLSAENMMQSDIYSLGLIMFEVLYQEEPFYGLNYAQLQKQVGDKGVTPEIPDSPGVSSSIQQIMKSCWDYNPKNRPTIGEVTQVLNQHSALYVEA